MKFYDSFEAYIEQTNKQTQEIHSSSSSTTKVKKAKRTKCGSKARKKKRESVPHKLNKAVCTLSKSMRFD